eukprot:scaffold74056_cov72-Phaeocystis_antarctica.AAC.3
MRVPLSQDTAVIVHGVSRGICPTGNDRRCVDQGRATRLQRAAHRRIEARDVRRRVTARWGMRVQICVELRRAH